VTLLAYVEAHPWWTLIYLWVGVMGAVGFAGALPRARKCKCRAEKP